MRQQHILIVDDNEFTRRDLVRIFHDGGYTVTTAEDRQQVGVHLAAGPPDLILANVPQSSRNGVDLLIYMKQVFPRVPVLVVSVPAAEEMRQPLNRNGNANRSENHSHDAGLLDRIGLALTL